ncbi:unnamed protein product [Phyllotreta striolata]|uniref:Uncharacterized protein n=1 Tax=Phyllotreta striolata TaxID=444603 RepID=A0A9N9TKN2_PHYSR|nr:unnamed protein product [Phyllotreta striolata]
MWQNFFAESRLWIKPKTKNKKNLCSVYCPNKILRESGYGGISMKRYECSVVPQLPIWHDKTPYTSSTKWMESLESNSNEDNLDSESVSTESSTEEESDVFVTCTDSLNPSLTALSEKTSGTYKEQQIPFIYLYIFSFPQAQCISCEPTAMETRNTVNEISSNSVYFPSELTDEDNKCSPDSKESEDTNKGWDSEDENLRLQEYSSVQELNSSKDEYSLNDCISESRDLTVLRNVSVETDIKLCDDAEWGLSTENKMRLDEYLSKAHSIIYGVCQPPLLRIIDENHKAVIDEIQNIRNTVTGLILTLNQVEMIMKNLEEKVENINLNVTYQHDGFLIGVEAKNLDDFYKRVNCIKEVTGSALKRIQQLEELFGDGSQKEFNLIDENNIAKLEMEREKENKKRLFLKECKEGKIHKQIEEIEEIHHYLFQVQQFLEQIAVDQL